jgi:ArsR family transcriptional regulator, arsenate/arsenite/antimonite-responsive transcriptional repressor
MADTPTMATSRTSEASRDASELAAMCKALAHPARVEILRILVKRNACVCGDIVDALPLAQSTVSEHLRILKEAGLVTGEIEGPRTCYCVNKTAVAQLEKLVGKLFAR